MTTDCGKDKTLKALFIIESLDFEDEKNRREGRILQQILRLSGEKARYIYIRTAQELPFALEEFRRSNYRYLHISCQGSKDTIALTFDQLTFEDFAAEIRPYLANRRLFFSACSVVNEELAKVIIPASGYYSTSVVNVGFTPNCRSARPTARGTYGRVAPSFLGQCYRHKASSPSICPRRTG
jgi:hypothetical protein